MGSQTERLQLDSIVNYLQTQSFAFYIQRKCAASSTLQLTALLSNLLLRILPQFTLRRILLNVHYIPKIFFVLLFQKNKIIFCFMKVIFIKKHI